MNHLSDTLLYELSEKLNVLARHLGSLNCESRGWANDGSAGAFARLVRIGVASIATADGPLTRQEKRILRVLFPSRNLRRDMSRSFVGRPMEPPALAHVVDSLAGFMSANAKRSAAYRAEVDPIVELMQDAGTMICACDQVTAASELSCLADMMTSLRGRAYDLEQSWTPPVCPDDVPTGAVPGAARPTQNSEPVSQPIIQPTDEERPISEHVASGVQLRPETMQVIAPSVSSPLQELHSLIGLQSVKHEVETLANVARVLQLRRKRGMVVPKLGYHLVFTGNPGTGKTTVARILAAIYAQLGIVRSGHLIEVDRSGLVGGYLGQTAIKVKEVVESALGGILFIDEAYSLAGREPDPYGAEAIETLLKAMEDHRDEFVLIVAGYPRPMEKFLISNPGLQSRFSRKIHFPDYHVGEMKEIFKRMVQRDGFTLATDAEKALDAVLSLRCLPQTADFANARDVRNLFEQSIGKQANRLQTDHWITNSDLRTFTADDISQASDIFV